jgi:hypothetical protein
VEGYGAEHLEGEIHTLSSGEDVSIDMLNHHHDHQHLSANEVSETVNDDTLAEEYPSH